MRKLIKVISAAVLALSVTVPAVTVMSDGAFALTKSQARKCDAYASDKARSKTDRSALGGMLLGGVGGALFGNAVGGRTSTVVGGAAGAATGLAVGGSQYNRYYHKYFNRCAAKYDSDYGN
jgi:uncharacterized protein YcfJ